MILTGKSTYRKVSGLDMLVLWLMTPSGVPDMSSFSVNKGDSK